MSVYIYIYIFQFRCFGNLDFVLEGEEFDYKGRIEIANQRRGVWFKEGSKLRIVWCLK